MSRDLSRAGPPFALLDSLDSVAFERAWKGVGRREFLLVDCGRDGPSKHLSACGMRCLNFDCVRGQCCHLGSTGLPGATIATGGAVGSPGGAPTDAGSAPPATATNTAANRARFTQSRASSE